MNMESPVAPASLPEVILSATEARVLGCLIEKELATPDLYPLTLNSLVNACNQRSNRDPVMDVSAREAESAVDGLRTKKLATLFSGADARVFKYRQTLDLVYPMAVGARVVLCELLIRGPQTTAELRIRTERMHRLTPEEVEEILQEMAVRPSGPLVRRMARQPGQKELRWVQLLTGEPAVVAPGESPVVAIAPPVRSADLEKRIETLETEIAHLKNEFAALKKSLGES
ncbi:MAG: YceH family protein [Lacunisphaera sp.]